MASRRISVIRMHAEMFLGSSNLTITGNMLKDSRHKLYMPSQVHTTLVLVKLQPECRIVVVVSKLVFKVKR